MELKLTLKKKHLKKLQLISECEKISPAQLIKKNLLDYIKNYQFPYDMNQAFGLWQKKPVSSRMYQKNRSQYWRCNNYD